MAANLDAQLAVEGATPCLYTAAWGRPPGTIKLTQPSGLRAPRCVQFSLGLFTRPIENAQKNVQTNSLQKMTNFCSSSDVRAVQRNANDNLIEYC